MTDPKTAEVRDLLKHLAKYEATPPTLVDGEAHPLTLTADGKLRVDDPTTQALIAAVDAVVDAVKLKTDLIPADITAALDTVLPAVKTKTDTIAWADVTALEAKLDSATYGLAALRALLVIAQADLDNPNQYKADVSALALEATLTAIKGAGWTTQTLVALMTAIQAISGGATAQQVWEYATRELTDKRSKLPQGALSTTTGTVSGSGWIIGAFLGTSAQQNNSGNGYARVSLAINGDAAKIILDVELANSVSSTTSFCTGSAGLCLLTRYTTGFTVSIATSRTSLSQYGLVYISD